MKTPFDMIKLLQKILNMKMLYLAARFALLGWAAVGVSAVLRQDSLLFVFLSVIVILLILLEIGRLCFPSVGRHPAAFLILSIALCLLFFTARGADLVQIYYFFLLHDIFTIQKGKVPKALVAFHFAGFMGAEGYAVFVTEHEIFRYGFSDIIVVFVCYALILLIFAWIHYFKWELDKNINLREEIQRIIQKFDELGLVRIGLDYDSEADKAPGHVKEVIHKAIREGITNSIRHGSASSIQISIHCREDGVELVIEDNGSGCADIHKSFCCFTLYPACIRSRFSLHGGSCRNNGNGAQLQVCL